LGPRRRKVPKRAPILPTPQSPVGSLLAGRNRSGGRARRGRRSAPLTGPALLVLLAAWAAPDLAAPPAANALPQRSAEAVPGQVVPDNPCYDASCGPSEPIVVEYPTQGAGVTQVHPDGQTNLWAVKAAQAWAITKGSSSIVVAVLDTGVSLRNRQVGAKVLVGPNECYQDRPLCAGPYDQNGHGTFVTGIIAADTNDGIGIAGLGWNTMVVDIKVLDSNGQGSITDEVQGLRYALETPDVRVINLSFVNEQCPESSKCLPVAAEQQAIESAFAHDVVVVAAAGDNPSGVYNPAGLLSPWTVYPAGYPGVLSVAAATDQGVVDPVNGSPADDFSNYGESAEIAAPGIAVLSTWYDGNYAVLSGTSFAAPLVSAAAALMLASDPHLTAPEVDTLLVETSSPLQPGGVNVNSGQNGGFLDVAAAVQAAAAHQVPQTLDGYQLIESGGKADNAGFVAEQEPGPGTRISGRVVDGVEAPGGLGYWMVTSSGEVVAVGGAHDFGPDLPARLGQAVVGLAPTPDGGGYWLAGKRGGIFAFGDAKSFGSLVLSASDRPIVAITATPDGKGYWLVSSSGTVYTFGDAKDYGSTAGIHLRKPIVAMAATPDGQGYWLVAADGGVFKFGDAGYYGSAAAKHLGQPVVGIAVSPDGHGYWLAGKDGRVWNFGSAAYEVPEPAAQLSNVVAISS